CGLQDTVYTAQKFLLNFIIENRIIMDNINSVFTFDNLEDFSSIKEETDVKQDLGVHRENVKEEQMGKESLQPIFSVILIIEERQIPSSSGPIWNCENSRKTLGVRELRGDECMDLFMPVENRTSYQFSDYLIEHGKLWGNNGEMQKLPSLSELVDAINDVRDFHEFYEPKDEWKIDQMHKEYLSNTFGITDIHQLLVGCYGMVILFLDDRGIVFTWCEITREMYLQGINKFEGLANFLYYPKRVWSLLKILVI
ncbi:464_t:CDS:2, partial [Funneliformis geosporum]